MKLTFPISIMSAVVAMGLQAAGDPEPIAACPPPKINTLSWQLVTLADCNARLKLPRRYREHAGGVVIGRIAIHIFLTSDFDRIEVQLVPPMFPDLDRNKTIRQSNYQGFTECTELVAGRDAIIQSFRGGGMIFKVGRPIMPYHATALWKWTNNRLLSLDAGVSSRESQEEVLAAVRTVEFVR